MTEKIHILTGNFSSRKEAILYTEPQWEPEPGDEVSDEEYAMWENSNPKWKMRDELGIVNLNQDFVETIDGQDRFKYLEEQLQKPSESVEIVEGGDNILVLIHSNALEGSDLHFKDTSCLKYWGEFQYKIKR